MKCPNCEASLKLGDVTRDDPGCPVCGWEPEADEAGQVTEVRATSRAGLDRAFWSGLMVGLSAEDGPMSAEAVTARFREFDLRALRDQLITEDEIEPDAASVCDEDFILADLAREQGPECLPCPLCWSEAAVYGHQDFLWVKCEGCGVGFPPRRDEHAKVIAAWIRRAPRVQREAIEAAAEIERLRACVRFAATIVDGIGEVDLHEAAYQVRVARTGVDDGEDATEDDYAEAFIEACAIEQRHFGTAGEARGAEDTSGERVRLPLGGSGGAASNASEGSSPSEPDTSRTAGEAPQPVEWMVERDRLRSLLRTAIFAAKEAREGRPVQLSVWEALDNVETRIDQEAGEAPQPVAQRIEGWARSFVKSDEGDVMLFSPHDPAPGYNAAAINRAALLIYSPTSSEETSHG